MRAPSSAIAFSASGSLFVQSRSDHAAGAARDVFAQQRGEKLGWFRGHRIAHRGGFGKFVRVRLRGCLQLMHAQPLPGETLRERARFRIAQYPARLRFEQGWVAQFLFVGDFEKLGVGHRRSQEIRKAAREFVIAHGLRFRASRHFDAEKKMR